MKYFLKFSDVFTFPVDRNFFLAVRLVLPRSLVRYCKKGTSTTVVIKCKDCVRFKITDNKNEISIGNHVFKVNNEMYDYALKHMSCKNDTFDITSVPLVSSCLHTPSWRQEHNLSAHSHEQCQRYWASINIGYPIFKCKHRINSRTLQFEHNPHPYTKPGGYDWTEDFDGRVTIDNLEYFFNFKFVVPRGGDQTRALRLVYIFVESQLKYLKTVSDQQQTPPRFINILDGFESYRCRAQFEHLLNSEEYAGVRNFVMVADSDSFSEKWDKFGLAR